MYEATNFAHFTYTERIGVAYQLGAGEIGAVLRIGTVLGIPGAFGVVWLGGRFGCLRPVLFGVVAKMPALLLLLSGSGIVIYTAAMCLLGAGWAFVLPYLQAMAADLDAGGSVVVAAGTATSVGGALGPGAGSPPCWCLQAIMLMCCGFRCSPT